MNKKSSFLHDNSVYNMSGPTIYSAVGAGARFEPNQT